MTINLKEPEAAEVRFHLKSENSPDIFDPYVYFHSILSWGVITDVNVRTQLCNADFFTADVILHCIA
jgi:hypothetical protein